MIDSLVRLPIGRDIVQTGSRCCGSAPRSAPYKLLLGSFESATVELFSLIHPGEMRFFSGYQATALFFWLLHLHSVQRSSPASRRRSLTSTAGIIFSQTNEQTSVSSLVLQRRAD